MLPVSLTVEEMFAVVKNELLRTEGESSWESKEHAYRTAKETRSIDSQGTNQMDALADSLLASISTSGANPQAIEMHAMYRQIIGAAATAASHSIGAPSPKKMALRIPSPHNLFSSSESSAMDKTSTSPVWNEDVVVSLHSQDTEGHTLPEKSETDADFVDAHIG